jgi:hypothetical protein
MSTTKEAREHKRKNNLGYFFGMKTSKLKIVVLQLFTW